MTFSKVAKTTLCRTYQKSAFVLSFFLPWSEKALLKGTGSFKKLGVYIKDKNIENVLIVVDSAIEKNGLLEPALNKLDELGIMYSIAAVSGNANAETAEKCAKVYNDNECKAIIAVGGGSVIDCAKLAGIKAVNAKKNIADMEGFKPIMRRSTQLFAVPTTVGAGSEASFCVTCFDKKAKRRNVVSSPALRPDAAVLDPLMTEALPGDVLAKTAMAALCQGVEAYLSTSGTKAARDNAATAVRLVFDNIIKAYEKNDTDARIELQKAAYLAGLAADRNHAGYAHHIALAVSAANRVSYAETAAATLSFVLKEYGEKAYKRLATLADTVKLKGETDEDKAKAFISAIENLDKSLSIAENVKQIKKKDIPKIAKRVCGYCNPSYPAPKMLFFDDICDLLVKIKG